MSNVLSVTEFYDHKVSFTITKRISNAIDMLTFHEKCNTEQETDGEFNVFEQDLYKALEPYNVFFNVHIKYYRGVEDVIVEISVFINQRGENPEKPVPIKDERIVGTVLVHLFKHFGLSTNNYAHNRVVLNEEDYGKDMKKLTIFAK
jgi:hypothetical protein